MTRTHEIEEVESKARMHLAEIIPMIDRLTPEKLAEVEKKLEEALRAAKKDTRVLKEKR